MQSGRRVAPRHVTTVRGTARRGVSHPWREAAPEFGCVDDEIGCGAHGVRHCVQSVGMNRRASEEFSGAFGERNIRMLCGVNP